MANRRGKTGNSDRFHFLAHQNHYSRWLQPITLITLVSWKESHDTPQFNSVQFSHSVMSDSFQPHGLQHARPPCPSPTPRVYSNSCPLSWWCHPTTSSSVLPFSSHLQYFPASGSFKMSQLFTSGCQSIGVSASASVLPIYIQDWIFMNSIKNSMNSMTNLDSILKSRDITFITKACIIWTMVFQ